MVGKADAHRARAFAGTRVSGIEQQVVADVAAVEHHPLANRAADPADRELIHERLFLDRASPDDPVECERLRLAVLDRPDRNVRALVHPGVEPRPETPAPVGSALDRQAVREEVDLRLPALLAAESGAAPDQQRAVAEAIVIAGGTAREALYPACGRGYALVLPPCRGGFVVTPT